MSIQLMTWALYGDRGTLDPADKLLLVVLADHAGPEGIAWPSWSILAQGSGLSRATVARRIPGLVDRGLIERVEDEHCPASWAKMRADRRPKAYRLAGSQIATPQRPRGLTSAATGSQIGPHGVSAVRPNTKEPKEPNAHVREAHQARAAAASVDHKAWAAKIREGLSA